MSHGLRSLGTRALAIGSAVAISVALVLPSAVAEPTPTLAEVKRQVEQLNHRMEQATERFNEANERATEGQRRADVAQAAVDRQQKRLDKLNRDMGGFAAATYRQGGVDPAIQVLLSDRPEDFLAGASMADLYVEQQVSALTVVAEERRQLEARQAAVAQELAAVNDSKAKAISEQAAIEKDLAASKKLLDSLEATERAKLERERAAERTSRSTVRAEDFADVPASGRGAVAVRFAMAQLGEPYRYGSSGPNSWDCSGLTGAAWRAAGVSLPRVSRAQIGAGTRVSRANLRPGDLVFFYSPISHVGIYIGGGKMVHATHPGDVVSVDSISTMPFSGATRPG